MMPDYEDDWDSTEMEQIRDIIEARRRNRRGRMEDVLRDTERECDQLLDRLTRDEAEVSRLRGLLGKTEAKLLYYENAEACSDSLPNDAVAEFVKDVQRLQPTDAYQMVDACFREMRTLAAEIPMESE